MRSNEYDDALTMASTGRREVLSSPRYVSAAVRTSVGIVVRCVVGLLLLRFMVLVAEARAMIVTERSSDDELMHLCTSGAARESAHMRAACMKATVDRASPALARALTRGAYAFASELYALFSEPFKACSLLGAVGVLSVLPWVGTLWTVLIAGNVAEVSRGRGASGEGDHTVVILRNGEMPWDPAGGRHASLRFRPVADDVQKGRAHTGRITELS
jgi:hypothetical protein